MCSFIGRFHIRDNPSRFDITSTYYLYSDLDSLGSPSLKVLYMIGLGKLPFNHHVFKIFVKWADNYKAKYPLKMKKLRIILIS